MDELVSVGEICGVFGTEGYVKVRPLTDFPERFNSMREVLIQRGQKVELFKVESICRHGEWLLFKFAGIDSREGARSLNAGLLKVSEAEVFPLPEGSYYIFQLQGLEVYDEEKGFLGVLTDVIQTGANDVYVVKGKRYGEILIPALIEVVKDINLDERRVQVKLLPGLIDEGEDLDAD